MRYLSLGDSISIDDYTGVPAGGAASQFARLIKATDHDSRTRDGRTTSGVLEALQEPYDVPDVVTLTACGNDLLVALASIHGDWQKPIDEIFSRYDQILDQLRRLSCPTIINTVYDPTDGKDDLAVLMGLPHPVRAPFDRVNDHIRSGAGGNLILSDLERLFAGHGYWSADPWITGYIEPNYPGATAIARHWHSLFLDFRSESAGFDASSLHF
ncbi:MAG TPA: SGNH/GDSL hydrolase family protein [Fimbriimonadaceae bacterium]|nr:SGNH/GDSL hydrolase family protein [Fimbriimonadaceae bacterium]